MSGRYTAAMTSPSDARTENDVLLTTVEVAKVLKLSRQRIYQFIEAGRLVPSQQITGNGRTITYLFTQEEVARFKREGRRKAG